MVTSEPKDQWVCERRGGLVGDQTNEHLISIKDGTRATAGTAFRAVWQQISNFSYFQLVIKFFIYLADYPTFHICDWLRVLKVRYHKQRIHWHQRIPGTVSWVWNRRGHYCGHYCAHYCADTGLNCNAFEIYQSKPKICKIIANGMHLSPDPWVMHIDA